MAITLLKTPPSNNFRFLSVGNNYHLSKHSKKLYPCHFIDKCNRNQPKTQKSISYITIIVSQSLIFKTRDIKIWYSSNNVGYAVASSIQNHMRNIQRFVRKFFSRKENLLIHAPAPSKR